MALALASLPGLDMPKRVDSDDRIAVGEAARRLGVSPRAVQDAIARWEHGGEGLPAVRREVPGQPRPIWMIRPADLVIYQARQAGRPRRGPRPRRPTAE